ncbi:MAG: extracellular solute-binding protein [Firmicutes bacterium]|nr:extracellular solute-binding protein [Bacillota bacterium]
MRARGAPAAADRRRSGPALLLAALLLAGCAAPGAGGSASPASGAGRAGTGGGPSSCRGAIVRVAYAASLLDLMEHRLRPAFEQATGCRLRGYPGGSQGLAQQIRSGLRRVDVFVSASPSVNGLLEEASSAQRLRWYVAFAEAPLVIAYNPRSRFAAELRRRPWYEVLAEPGFRLGRTDPRLDPKGALTLRLVEAASARYHLPDLPGRLLGSAGNPAQIFPEEELLGRLEAGQLDAGFFYANEAKAAGLPVLVPEAAIDPAATYTFTLLEGAPEPQAGVAFLRWLAGEQGRALLAASGLRLLPLRLSGDPRAVPAELAPLLGVGR